MINQKGKKNSQPDGHRDEVKECHVQEWLTFINMLHTPFSQFPQPFLVSSSLFMTSLRRISTYAWSISSPLRWILLSIFNEPWEGVVWFDHIWWFQHCLMILQVQWRYNSTTFSCLDSLKKTQQTNKKIQSFLFLNLVSWI